MHYVYILYSASTDRYYRGQTADLGNRIARHNRGEVGSTALGVPWELVWFTEKANRSQGVLLEQKLKNLSRARLIQFMKKYKSGYVGKSDILAGEDD